MVYDGSWLMMADDDGQWEHITLMIVRRARYKWVMIYRMKIHGLTSVGNSRLNNTSQQ